jgi:hypothetical protein
MGKGKKDRKEKKRKKRKDKKTEYENHKIYLNEKEKELKFRYITSKGAPATYIHITNGFYKGLVYYYGRIAFTQQERSDGRMPVEFEYRVVENPEDRPENQRMINMMGEVLTYVIADDLEKRKQMREAGIDPNTGKPFETVEEEVDALAKNQPLTDKEFEEVVHEEVSAAEEIQD